MAELLFSRGILVENFWKKNWEKLISVEKSFFRHQFSIIFVNYLLIILSISSLFPHIIYIDYSTASMLYSAVINEKVALPCDINPPSLDDSVALILWYKDDSLAPIVTIDARKGKCNSIGEAKRIIIYLLICSQM